MYKRQVLARRCVVPTTGFYEWDAARHKYLFQLPGSALLYLAGLYDYVDSQGRYVILTTAPNASMAPIHDRMPLVLQDVYKRRAACRPLHCTLKTEQRTACKW